MATTKGFIKDYQNNILLPITRGELILDSKGYKAFESDDFLATTTHAGLMSAAEKAMLNGSSGQGLSDIYNKLSNINDSLYIGNTLLKFYDDSGNKKINIVGVDKQINISTQNNNINIGLSEIGSESTIQNIIKNISVDKYGRVTKVEGSKLTDDEIPETLSNKKLKNCVILNENNSTSKIASEDYVNLELSKIEQIATGALVFGGLIGDNNKAGEVLNNNNKYYKVNAAFEITRSYLSDPDNTPTLLKVGDTLIVQNEKFIYIPSGDEIQTTLTIKQGDTKSLNSSLGDITLDFASPFIINSVGSDNNSANISISKVSDSQDGYLSAADYVKFSTYAAKTITYTPILTSGYEIGKLNFGDNNDISVYTPDIDLTLTNINNVPTLNFEKTGKDSSKFSFKGENGIAVTLDSSTIKFSATNNVDEQSKSYLNVENFHKFKILKGSYSSDTNTITDGITDYREFHNFKTASISAHALATQFLEISNSLSPSSTDGLKYYYGSTDLVTAITL